MTSGKFRCDQPGDICPGTLRCIAGLCQAPGDDAPLKQDLAPGPQPDGAGPTPSCSGGGTPLVPLEGDEVYACRGRFDLGKFAALGRSGFHVCGAQEGRALAATASAGGCELLSGFFAAQLEAAFVNQAPDVTCRAAAMGGRATLIGCGVERRGIDGGTTVVVARGCRGLRSALPCDSGADGWSCTTRLANATHSEAARGGVLCCRDR